MEYAKDAGLVALLTQQSDRQPIGSIGAAELTPYDPRFVKWLISRGVLREREDLSDDSTTLLGVVDDVLLAIDPLTGACERVEDPLERQTFDVDMRSLCRAIREQSRLAGPKPAPISRVAWRLGRLSGPGRTAEVCLVRSFREGNVQEVLDHVRGACDPEAPVIVVSLRPLDLATPIARQLDKLRMTLVSAEHLLGHDPTLPFAFDLGQVRVASATKAKDARLVIDPAGRLAALDEVELVIEPRDFGVLVMLAEEAADAGGWVSRERLAAALESSTLRDSNPEQVDKAINRVRDAFRKNPRLKAVPDDGFIERKSKVGGRLTFSSAEVEFVG